MPASSNIISSIARSDPVCSAPVFRGGGRTRPLTVVRNPRARRMRLAIDPRDGAIRLTLPPRAGLAAALAWAESQRGWIEAALAALPVPVPLGPGGSVPFEGEALAIDWQPGHPRAIRREGGALRLGGPEELIEPRLLRWLRGEARARLEAETRAPGAAHNIAIGRIRIGDPRSRWGSCSAAGDIAYSWRLILAPPAVRAATIAHEVAHRIHMDHGRAFHAEVARLFGREPTTERAWLRAHGREIQAIGRR